MMHWLVRSQTSHTFSRNPVHRLYRRVHTTVLSKSPQILSVGIRKEDKNNWERRVALTPDHVERLVKEVGAKVYIQPSTKRVFPDHKYEQAGAVVQDDLSLADIIVGVKEVPIDKLIADKTYLFFSHTHKGQKYNMPLLKSILDNRVRLIDYELLTNDAGRRLVQFSKFAGYAGMVDGFHGLGHRLLALGYATPFLAIGMSYMYRCIADARLDVTRSGLVIMDDGLPPKLGPMIFVFTGDGNVTKGALHVFKCLPHEWIQPNDLKSFYESKNWSPYKVYGCQVRPQDYCVRKDGKAFDREHYRTNPEAYESVFHEKIAPYATTLINGIFWNESYPRLLTKSQTQSLASSNNLRLLNVADISCDINGSLEFTSHSSTISSPFFMYDPESTKIDEKNESAKGIQIMSIDNLPTELPLEASEHFSAALIPHVTHLVKGNKTGALERATITESGELIGKHLGLKEIVDSYGTVKVNKRSRVLILGSGFVAGPVVDYLARSPTCFVTIGSNNQAEAKLLSKNRTNVTVAPMNVDDTKGLRKLVNGCDVVISLVPAPLHPRVAEACLDESTNMVTASYISPAMASLHTRAKSTPITILNELGLDPGIDHLTAMQLFDTIRSKGGRVTSFVSWCGGLPAPECSANPFGYKFSWSPRGVITAGLNGARYKMRGEVVDIPGSQLLKSASPVSISPGFAMEGLPNRDSLAYLDTYNLGSISDIDTMFRGTLRYKGYSELMAAISDLGLLNLDPTSAVSGGTWPDLMTRLLGPSPAHQAIATKLGVEPGSAIVGRVLDALTWLGTFTPTTPLPPSPTHLDAFSSLLQSRMGYKDGERDMVAMKHLVGVKWGNGKRETLTSTLITYGDPVPTGYTAMARTVGVPAAIGAELLINGTITRKGVLAPVTKDIYVPVLERLEKEGVRFVEGVEQS